MTPTRGGKRLASVLFLLVLNGCASVIREQSPAPVTPAPVTPAPVTPAPVTPAPVTPAPGVPAPVTPAPGVPARPDGPRTSASPIPDQAIHLIAHCAQTEEDGFREDATLEVQNNVVAKLSWKLWVGKRGSCHFELGGLTQTRRHPFIELQSLTESACRLMIWQERGRVTISHANCPAQCTPGVAERAWPVSFDSAGGGCSKR
jgi:hypothetical protein